jgi:hypothetical protein
MACEKKKYSSGATNPIPDYVKNINHPFHVTYRKMILIL